MSESKSTSTLAAAFRGLSRNLMLRGLIELVIGILLLCKPVSTIKWLTIIIGLLLILDGLLMFASYLRTKGAGSDWMIVNAIALVALGAVTVSSPLMMDYLWIIMLGAWHIVSAVNELAGGGWRRLLGIASCVLSLIIGVIFIMLPFVGLQALITVAGIVLIASGVFSLLTGADLRAASRKF